VVDRSVKLLNLDSNTIAVTLSPSEGKQGGRVCVGIVPVDGDSKKGLASCIECAIRTGSRCESVAPKSSSPCERSHEGALAMGFKRKRQTLSAWARSRIFIVCPIPPALACASMIDTQIEGLRVC